ARKVPVHRGLIGTESAPEFRQAEPLDAALVQQPQALADDQLLGEAAAPPAPLRRLLFGAHCWRSGHSCLPLAGNWQGLPAVCGSLTSAELVKGIDIGFVNCLSTGQLGTEREAR